MLHSRAGLFSERVREGRMCCCPTWWRTVRGSGRCGSTGKAVFALAAPQASIKSLDAVNVFPSVVENGAVHELRTEVELRRENSRTNRSTAWHKPTPSQKSCRESVLETIATYFPLLSTSGELRVEEDRTEMTVVPLSAGLEILEKSEIDSLQLIDHACAVLKLDIAKVTSSHLKDSNDAQPTQVYTFREQWVLRWLIKQLAAGQSNSKSSQSNAQVIDLATTSKAWMLLLHLLNAIPRPTAAEILADRKFLQVLDSSVRRALVSPSATSSHEYDLVSHSSPDGAGEESPRKRRRISPVAEQDLRPNGGADQDHDIIRLVFHVCCQFAKILSSHSVEGSPEEHLTISNWSSSVRQHASLFAASVRAALAATNHAPDTDGTLRHLPRLRKLLFIWHERPTAVSENARLDETKTFNSLCLLPCLQLFVSCSVQTRKDDSYNSFCKEVEKLIALNIILPLRRRFNDRLSKVWTKERKCLAWEDIKPVYESTFDLLWPDLPPTQHENTRPTTPEWQDMTHHLYSIAVRLIPTADVRRKQWEQPWLDALLVALCYISCPSLPRLHFIPPEAVTTEDSVTPPAMKDEESLRGLLQVALDHRVTISLHLLSYLACSVLSWNPSTQSWKLLSRLVALDANVLIPGLSIPTSDRSIELLDTKISASKMSAADYIILQDDVVRPLVRGFGRSRALKDFLQLWQPGLKRALLDSANLSLGEPEVPAVLVWDDEDTIDQVSEVTREFATPSIVQDALDQSLRSIRGFDGMVESTVVDTLVHTIICSTVIRAMQDPSAYLGSLADLQDGAIQALHQPREHVGQIWRLWNLLRLIQSKKSLPILTAEIASVKGVGAKSYAIRDLDEELMVEDGSPGEWMERLERFALLVQQGSRKQSPLHEELRTEIEALRKHTASISNNAPPWNGRPRELSNASKFISACLTCLLVHPEAIQLSSNIAVDLAESFTHDTPLADLQNPDSPFVNELLVALIGNETLDWKSELGNRFVESILKTAFSLDRGSQNEAPANQLVNSIPFEPISRSRLRDISSRVFKKLHQNGQAMSLEIFAFHLALLERLSLACPAAFREPESWHAWVNDIIPHFERLDVSISNQFAVVACQCISTIFGNLVNAIIDKSATSNNTLLTVLRWCEDHIDVSSPRPETHSSNLALHITMISLWAARGQLTQSMPADEMESLAASHINNLFVDLADRSTRDSLFPANRRATLVALQLLSQLEELPPMPPDTVERLEHARGSVKTLLLKNGADSFLEEIETLLSQLLPVSDEPVGVKLSEHHLSDLLDSFDSSHEVTDYQRISLFTQRANNLVRTLDANGRADFMDILLQPIRHEKAGPAIASLIALIIIRTDHNFLSASHRLVEHFATVASLRDVATSKDCIYIILMLENATLALERHPKLVNQAVIDKLLANLGSILCSASSVVPRSTSNTVSAIFNRICAVLGSVLGRFRRRIADRHHLLLPVLQGLLRCLSYPGSDSLRSLHRSLAQGSNPGAFLKSLPHWLLNSPIALPPSSAEKFSRLISSISNPTISAARSSRKRSSENDLNDPTKQVRLLAGEHMQYLLMEYCRCSLDGEINPAIKEKIMPGLYTVLDAMTRDLMRAMNASMDPSSRAIFKGLYDDWSRYGKWDKT